MDYLEIIIVIIVMLITLKLISKHVMKYGMQPNPTMMMTTAGIVEVNPENYSNATSCMYKQAKSAYEDELMKEKQAKQTEKFDVLDPTDLLPDSQANKDALKAWTHDTGADALLETKNLLDVSQDNFIELNTWNQSKKLMSLDLRSYPQVTVYSNVSPWLNSSFAYDPNSVNATKASLEDC